MSETHSAENYDPSEVRKFEDLASRWWVPYSEFKPLHDINPLRLQYIADHVGLAGKRILDVGCGGRCKADLYEDCRNAIFFVVHYCNIAIILHPLFLSN